jgi:hypothetical protein
MEKRRQILGTLVLVAASLLAAAAGPVARSQDAGLAVIVHPGAAVTELSRLELQAIFTSTLRSGRTGPASSPSTSRRGTRTGSPSTGPCSAWTETRSSRFWIDQRIRGAPRGPRSVPNADLIPRVIARMSGGVGYAPEARVPMDGSVRIVARVRATRSCPAIPRSGSSRRDHHAASL